MIPEREHTEGILSTAGAANDEEIMMNGDEAPLATSGANSKEALKPAPIQTAIEPINEQAKVLQEKRAGLKTTQNPPKQTSNEPANVQALEDVLDKPSEDKNGPREEEEECYEDD